MKLLCYTRPWNEANFARISREAFPDAEIEYVSDFLGQGTVQLQEEFYIFYSKCEGFTQLLSQVGHLKIKDICSRCRLLRNIPKEQATRMCAAMWLALQTVLDQVNPDVILSTTIDSYCLDLLHLACQLREIKFIGIIPCFINGYFRVTSRGEYNYLRAVSDTEIEKSIAFLEKSNYTPDFLVGLKPESSFDALFKGVQKQSRNIARFLYYSFTRTIRQDPLSLHTYSSYVIARQNLNFYSFSQLKYVDLSHVEVSKYHRQKKIFIPLQYFPECTVDYWCESIEYIDYYNTLFALLDVLSSLDFVIYVKEHPAFCGLRPYHFYSKLKTYQNIINLSPNIAARQAISFCDVVLVWTGSVGFEAAFKGTPVIHLGNPYYISGKNFYYLDSIGKLSDILAQIDTKFTKDPESSYKEKRELLSHVLSGCLSGNISPIINGSVDSHSSEVDHSIQSIRELRDIYDL